MEPLEQSLDSFGQYTSLAADSFTKQLGPSARPAHPLDQCADYGFISFLGLAQRLKIDFLPITWQVPLGLVGRGGQAQVSQSLINLQISLAFKRYDHIRQLDAFREVVQELLVLNHPLVRSHPHIVRLEGICWDIPENGQVWPVLVFQKTAYGDLYTFSKSEVFQYLSMAQKLNLCADIGLAIRDMHHNNIIHGDIKPENILISTGNNPEYHPLDAQTAPLDASVADFGFSTWFQEENDLILMPKSEPWCAPEHEGQLFYPLQAKQMDTFSFGMLCVWLLFEAGRPGNLPQLPAMEEDDGSCVTFGRASATCNLLDIWKRDGNNTLSKWAEWLILEDANVDCNVKDNLTRFAQYTLAFNGQERNIDFTQLIRLLNPDRNYPHPIPMEKPALGQEEAFELPRSIRSLYWADFRLRLYIPRCLESIANTSIQSLIKHVSPQRAALQLALCYMIGFGVARNVQKVDEILQAGSVNHGELESLVNAAQAGTQETPSRLGLYPWLRLNGFLMETEYFHHYREQNLLREAVEVYRREAEDLQDVFGETNRLCLDAKSTLSSILLEGGRFEEAAEISLQLMEIQKRMLGVDNPNTLTAMSNLSLTYQNLGRWEEAQELEEQVESARQRALGPENPITLNSVVKLASIYRKRGQWATAETLEVNALSILQRVLGEEHQEVLGSMASLASTYHEQGRWKEAENLEVQVLESYTRVLGEEHPRTLAIMANLVQTYQCQGRWDEAEELDMKILKARKKVFGDGHPDTLASISSLSNTLWNQGRWEESERLDMQAMKLMKEKLGPEHPDTLTCVSNLATTFWSLQKLDKAEKLESEVLDVYKRTLGLEHPQTLTSMSNLATTYRSQGGNRLTEGEELERRALEARKRVLGEEHPDTLISLSNVARMQMARGFKEEATSMMGECLRLETKVLGFEHPRTQDSFETMERWRDVEMEEEVIMTEPFPVFNSEDFQNAVEEDDTQTEPFPVYDHEELLEIVNEEHAVNT